MTLDHHETAEVVIIGAGPAGLNAATELRAAGIEVLILERESEPGGIPRHSDHAGYGLRDLRRSMRGPAYARVLTERALSAGAQLRTNAMVTGWAEDRSLDVTSPAGRSRITAGAVLLATGARERPRAARGIAGDRPAGILTTGYLQQLVHLQGAHVGERAVVVGADLVSWSAVLTLREASCRTVLMTTEHVMDAVSLAGRALLGGPLARRTRVTRINGRERVESVEVEHLDSGRRRVVECDTVVLTGDWIPDHELARTAGLEMDPASAAPVVDTALRAGVDGIFAAGNLVHPVDTADIAALDGAHAAIAIQRWLAGERAAPAAVRLLADGPLRWIAPGILRPGDPAPARERLLAWPDAHRRFPTVVASQGGRTLARRRLPWPLAPGRIFRIPWSVCADVDPFGGDVTVTVEGR